MGLFDALKKVGSAAVQTALLPVDVARDTVTLGGALTDEYESATVRRARKIARDASDAYEETFEE